MLNQIGVTRLPNGLSTAALDTIFSSMPFPNPTAFHVYNQDFDQYVAGDWTVTETQAGATQALVSGDGGLIALVNSAADNDINQIQKLPASFLLSATKQLFMSLRFKVSDATQSDIGIGLQNVNADGTDPAAVTDGIFVYKIDGETTIRVSVRKDATTGANNASTGIALADDTFVQVDFYYDGGQGNASGGRLYYAVNGSVLGYLDASSTYFPDVILAPMISLKNGEAVAKTLTVDRLYVAVQR